MASCSPRIQNLIRKAVMFLSLLCIPRGQADVNFFISQDSLYNDLKLSFTSDMYLIKDGQTAYLLSSPKGFRNFVNPLRPSIQSVTLSWFANPRNAMYSIDIKSSDTKIMPHPKLTISKEGRIEHFISDFKVFFPCSGKKSGTVDLVVSLNYTDIEMGQVQYKDMKYLNFMIRRECIAHGDFEENATLAHCNDKIQGLIYGTVAATSACVIMSVLFLFYCLHSNKKSKLNKKSDEEQEISTSTDNISESRQNKPVLVKVVTPSQNLSPPKKANGHIPKKRSCHKLGDASNYDITPRQQNFSSIAEGDGEEEEEREALMSRLSSSSTEDSSLKQIKEPNYHMLNAVWSKKLAGLIIQVDKVKVTKDLLGKGRYSCVYRGVARLHPKDLLRKDEVAVKGLTDKTDVELMECFASEALFMRDLSHTNVIRLLAVYLTPKQPLQLILQYTKHGSLHSYLTHCRTSSKLVVFTQLLNFAIQIARGMEYITSKRLIHRNLASRNCLVHKDKNIKISDFALTRHVGYSHQNKLRKPFPVKWTALEGLKDNNFSEKSDVWSCGVVLWELVTHALEPYEDIEESNVVCHLTEGHRLLQPQDCPDELFNIMSKCWLLNPSDRPSFSLLVKRLKAFETAYESTSNNAETAEIKSVEQNGTVRTEMERESTC